MPTTPETQAQALTDAELTELQAELSALPTTDRRSQLYARIVDQRAIVQGAALPLPVAEARIVLEAHQLQHALEFASPEYDTDEDQRETELVFQELPARMSSDGEPMEAGMYCWLHEYPEEGALHLETYSEFQKRTAPPPAQAGGLAA